MSSESEGRKKAAAFREQHGLGIAPIQDIVSLADLVEVDIIFVDGESNEHGLTARDTDTQCTVFVINSTLPRVRFRSTLAHELGHFLFEEDLSKNQNYQYSSAAETRAHAFARHLLLPIEAIRKIANEKPDLGSEQFLNFCVENYGVSPQVAAYQLNNSKVIDSDEVEKLSEFTTEQLAWKYGWLDRHKGLENKIQEFNTKHRLKKAAIRAYSDGRLSPTELASIIGSSLEEIEKNHPTLKTKDNIFSTLNLEDDDLSDLP